MHVHILQRIVADLLKECASELSPGRWVQTPEQLAAEPRRYVPGHVLMARLLDCLLG